MAVGEQRGVSDGLRKIYVDIAALQLLPDAPNHEPFLRGLMQAVQQYLQMQASATAQLGAPGGGMGGMGGVGGGMGAPMGGNPGGAGAPPAMMNAPGGGAGMTGLMGAASQNPDELRRMLAGAGGPPG